MRIGTRASKLALIQAAEVKNLLLSKTSLTEDQIEIIAFTTSGDKIQDRNLAEIGGKGLFIKELEESLLANKIDIAIHSAKDVPPMVHEATQIAAFTARKNPRDYFISHKFNSLQDLPQHAVVGTSSARRKAILLRTRPDLNIINFRGNVDTRLCKLAQGDVDATILATCGLERMQKDIEAQNIISLEDMLPAAGQGSLAIQIRKNDATSLELVRQINDEKSEVCVTTERAFLRELGASCKTPVAVYCWLDGDILNLQTIIFDFDGSEIFATKNSGDVVSGESLALKAAQDTKEQAAALLAKICD